MSSIKELRKLWRSLEGLEELRRHSQGLKSRTWTCLLGEPNITSGKLGPQELNKEHHK